MAQKDKEIAELLTYKLKLNYKGKKMRIQFEEQESSRVLIFYKKMLIKVLTLILRRSTIKAKLRKANANVREEVSGQDGYRTTEGSLNSTNKRNKERGKKMRFETFRIYFTDGTTKCVYCKKNDIEEYITVAELRRLDYIQQVNREGDKVNHKAFTIKF